MIGSNSRSPTSPTRSGRCRSRGSTSEGTCSGAARTRLDRAQNVDFVADVAYAVTPLAQGFADLLNKVATEGYARWEVGGKQEVLGQSFAPFGLVKGQPFKEYDLVHLADRMLFWGARHVDGRGFDTEANRPTNLQIPLLRA